MVPRAARAKAAVILQQGGVKNCSTTAINPAASRLGVKRKRQGES